MLLRQPFWRRLAIALLALTGLQAPLAQAQAAQSSGVFSVRIVLATQGIRATSLVGKGAASTIGNGVGQSRCVSASLEGPVEATIRVVCSSGQFVTIEAEAGPSFLTAFGEVYRYHYRFGPDMEAGPAWISDLGPGLANGTVTAYQVQRRRGWDDPLQFVVSF